MDSNLIRFVIVINTHAISIFGDFNINLLSLQNPLTTLFENYNLHQVIEEPTRVTANVSTLLDVIFVSNVLLVSNKGVLSADAVSDHKIIYCELNLAKINCSQKIVRYRCFKNFNVYNFNADMHNLPWDNIFYENDINMKISMFNNFILTLFDRHAPVRESRITKPKAPWLTENLKIFMRQRDDALRIFKQSKLLEDWNTYKGLRNFTLSRVRREKRKYIDSLFLNKREPSQLWNALKSFNICKNKDGLIPSFLSDPNEISNFFDLTAQVNPGCEEKTSYYNNNFYRDANMFSFHLTSPDEVNKILNNIKTIAM
ncbi:uncharacterized protein LOC126745322, partial [Anthonomus grandis grandis]|uniref:uncharacterized protein LOC126745322 n=1 Tax=Anthonomus grandis grandis TaxID=2921223 RepID=UPI002166B73D